MYKKNKILKTQMIVVIKYFMNSGVLFVCIIAKERDCKVDDLQY